MNERPRVLAVDDQEDMLQLIRLSLEEQFDVLTLSDPVAVSECMGLFEPDLLLLDVMMPKISGFQLLEVLRSDERLRSMPIIMLTAKAATREIKHGYKMGASLYLTKPFEPERLLRNVAMQIEAAGGPRPKARTMAEAAAKIFHLSAFRDGKAELGLSPADLQALREREADFRSRSRYKL